GVGERVVERGHDGSLLIWRVRKVRRRLPQLGAARGEGSEACEEALDRAERAGRGDRVETVFEMTGDVAGGALGFPNQSEGVVVLDAQHLEKPFALTRKTRTCVCVGMVEEHDHLSVVITFWGQVGELVDDLRQA